MIFLFICFSFNQSVPPELLAHFTAITFIAPHYQWNISALNIKRRMMDVTCKAEYLRVLWAISAATFLWSCVTAEILSASEALIGWLGSIDREIEMVI